MCQVEQRLYVFFLEESEMKEKKRKKKYSVSEKLWVKKKCCVNKKDGPNFFKSPIVSSSLHLTRTFFPNRSFNTTSIMIQCRNEIEREENLCVTISKQKQRGTDDERK